LDEKKYTKEKIKEDKMKFKNALENKLQDYELRQRELIKNLSDKLRLSEKFVKTSKF
jgi:hypothetical protein